jgi:RHS repeat-associated protein
VCEPKFSVLSFAITRSILLLALCCAASAQAPVITGFLVDSVGSNTGPVGATLTIQGTGFGSSMGWSTATLNGTALAGAAFGVSPMTWSNTSIVVTIPQTASSGPVIVTVSSEASNSLSFYIGGVITGLSSNSGLAGTEITINGQGFGTSGTVTFNGVRSPSTPLWTSSSIQAVVPTTATEGPVVVTASGSQPSNGWSFTPTPSITGLSTNSGVGGTTVTITGNSFGLTQAAGNSSVTFDGISAAVSSGKWSDTSITVTAPSAATTGNVVVTVNGVPSAGIMFTYIPSITSLSPLPVLADGPLTIGGMNFGTPLASDSVTFNGIAAAITDWTNNSIQVVVPGTITGSGTVVVSVNGVASQAYAFSLESAYSFGVTYAPDSDVLSVNDTVNGNWVYTYDGFNRLSCSNLSSNGSCASPTNGTPTYTYVYDRYANRWQQNGPYTMLLTFATDNQMVGYSYDAEGNLLNDGNHTYTYDAENRIIQVDNGQTATYVYDAEGQRVQKTTGSVIAQYLLDLSGNTITELNSAGVWTRGEIYANSRHLATYGDGSSGTIYFIQTDWLGTERARVLPNGDVAEACTNLPFGDGQVCSGVADPNPDHFTGKQRDTESGLDMFGARYYGSGLGRFITPDWAAKPTAVPYAMFGDPQSLNLYAYVRNNPLSRTDPFGHDDCDNALAGDTLCGTPFHHHFGKFVLAMAAGSSAFLGGEYLAGSALARNLVGLGLATAPRTVPIIVDAMEGYVNPGSPGTLTISSATRLTEQEISTGVRLADQTGKALAQSAHIGEEFVDAAGKTYDAMGGGKAFEHFGNGSSFLSSISDHLLKSVDYVAVDLKGASKEQIGIIKDFVKTLTNDQQRRIIFVP